jgi:hypothetical protein
MGTASRAALTPRQRIVARSIVASSQRMVDAVLARRWQSIPALLAERRSLLAQLLALREDGGQLQCQDGSPLQCIEALRAAVNESDRLLAGMMRGAARDPRG